MKRQITTILALAAIFMAGGPLSAQVPTAEQALGIKTASSPAISPDGRFIAYTVREVNWEENAFETEIWIAVASSGELYQLTSAKKSSYDPTWSPDGKRLAFVSDREGKNQIYLISPSGGEAVALTKSETGVGGFEWSPDGKRIAFTSSDPESEAAKERKKTYGEFEVVDAEPTLSHLWVVDVPAVPDAGKLPEAKRLTEGRDFTVYGFAWSPDGEKIAFSAPVSPDPGLGGTSDIYVLKVADKSLKKIVATPGPDNGPIWSPDGREIAFGTAAGREFYFYLNDLVAVVPAEGGTPRILDLGVDEDPSLVAWAPDGIYFVVLQKTSAHLFKHDLKTGKTERLTSPDDGLFGGFSFTNDYSRLALTASGPNRFSEVCLTALKPFDPKRLTAMGDQLKPFRPSVREVVRWTSKDGTPIDGVLHKPADFAAGKRYPLLVVIHGGPTGIDMPTLSADRYYPIEQFVAKGALVLRPNYRGSAGYGEKFRSLNVRNLGVGDAWDVVSGVDALIAKGIVDRDRVGAMGWSQGGYISAFLTTWSDRFRAVSVGAGISDWMTYYVNTDIHPFTRQYLKATPWDDPEVYRKTSPISYLKTAKTPTLIQHGEFDRRVPIPNAYELYQALQDKGVPVKMIVYKGFGHGITKPKELRAVMEHNYDWFLEYIWGEKPAKAGR